ncbi:MAG: MarC family protein [Planctomycetota bacterium]
MRASLIAGVCFFVVALLGEALFEDLLQVRYAAFLLFGGAIFLLVGLRMVFQGPDAILKVRGEPEHLAGSIAMPFLIGPGTVNASILIGRELNPLGAAAVIASALVLSMIGVLAVKALFDGVRSRNAKLIQRYVDIVGRISALIVGSIAVEMMLSGIDRWQGR